MLFRLKGNHFSQLLTKFRIGTISRVYYANFSVQVVILLLFGYLRMLQNKIVTTLPTPRSC